MKSISYSQGILEAFDYILNNYKESFVIGQGLWSPWYVGNTMKNLEKKFGKHRLIDTPVSESACTATAIGASLVGTKPIVVHPRMDFMIYAMDTIVNQAAKWSHMFGGAATTNVTIRSIINRGGEQGAQHSQALHSWLAHIPGLRVVMPATAQDARDLLISSVLCNDPVIYIDDRWLYDNIEKVSPVKVQNLENIGPKILKKGKDISIVGLGYSTYLCVETEKRLSAMGYSAEVIDIRVLNPFKSNTINKSVSKTGRILVVDGGWRTCGFSSEILASLIENIKPSLIKTQPIRLTLPDCPAPASRSLEKYYYTNVENVVAASLKLLHEVSAKSE